jgi:hypothetical protein
MLQAEETNGAVKERVIKEIMTVKTAVKTAVKKNEAAVEQLKEKNGLSRRRE